jgi:hypothetical protein
MQPTVKPSNRLDVLDIEAFEAMLGSPSFCLLKERIANELRRAQSDCESFNDVRELRRAQGAVRALRAVLTLPEAILKEMRIGRRG